MFTTLVDVLPDNIKQIRLDMKLTQKAWAELLGVKLNTAQKYESGEIVPSLAVLYRISEISGKEFRVRDEIRHPLLTKTIPS